MNETSLIMFICLIIPLSMMVFVFKGESKTILIFLLLGITGCLIAGIYDEFVFTRYNLDRYYLTVNITPMIEEIIKSIPIILYSCIKKPEQKYLIECSIALGIGFATLENFCIMYTVGENISIIFAIIRGIGTGLMHGLCSLMVGFALSYANENKFIILPGVIAALSTAIIFHSIYNIIVQSSFSIIGIALPLLCYVPLIIINNKKEKKYEENC